MRTNIPLRLTVLIFLAIFTYPIFAQDKVTPPPIPSDIDVKVDKDKVIINWTNKANIEDGFNIYLHTQMPNQDNFNSATLIASVDSNTLEYVYTPQDTKEYYYFILGKNNLQNPEFFIRYMNASGPTKIEKLQTVEKEYLSGINTEIKDKSIIISINTPKDSGELFLLRSTEKIISTESIFENIDSKNINEKDYPIFVDKNASKNTDYYYAIIKADDYFDKSFKFEIGKNSTENPVKIKEDSTNVSIRQVPLPLLVFTKSIDDATNINQLLNIPKEKELNHETEIAITSLVDKYGVAQEQKKEIIFEEDIETPKGNDPEYELKKIIKDHYDKKIDINIYKTKLEKYKNMKNEKAIFYLAQAQAISQEWEEAFFNFLLVEDIYKKESMEWIYYILNNINN